MSGKPQNFKKRKDSVSLEDNEQENKRLKQTNNEPKTHRNIGPQCYPAETISMLMKPQPSNWPDEIKVTNFAIEVHSTKQWQLTITLDNRNHIIHKVFQSIFYTTNLLEMLNKTLRNIVIFARTMEKMTFEAADSTLEYYHLLATKMHQLQKTLMKRRGRMYSLYEKEHAISKSPGLMNLAIFEEIFKKCQK